MEKKQIALELCNIYGHFYVAWYAAAEGAGNAAADRTEYFARLEGIVKAGHAARSVIRYAAGWMAGDAVCDVARGALWAAAGKEAYAAAYAAAKEAAGLNEDKIKQVVSEASCRVVISKRKEIRQAIFQKVEEKLPTRLATIGESKNVQRLLAFHGMDLDSLKRTITIQKCNSLFAIERLIRLTNNFHLLKEHQVLAKELGVQAVYERLYPVVIDVATHVAHKTFPELPRELIGIIVEYCQFCWLSETDEDVFYDRLLLLPKD